MGDWKLKLDNKTLLVWERLGQQELIVGRDRAISYASVRREGALRSLELGYRFNVPQVRHNRTQWPTHESNLYMWPSQIISPNKRHHCSVLICSLIFWNDPRNKIMIITFSYRCNTLSCHIIFIDDYRDGIVWLKSKRSSVLLSWKRMHFLNISWGSK